MMIWPLFFLFINACASRYEGPVSDHFNGKTFFNPGQVIDKGLGDVLKWKWTSDPTPWPSHISNTHSPQFHSPHREEALLTFIGHSTFVLQWSGLNVITDPIFSPRASPVNFAGPKRVRDPGCKLQELPKIDVVVVGHNHYDHMDIPSLKELHRLFRPLFIVPLGNKKILQKHGITQIQELDWWEKTLLNGYEIILAPAQHWSKRSLIDTNESLWGSFLIRPPQDSRAPSLYFASDTGYGPHFKLTREKLGPVDLALIPIGSYEPRWFMKAQHTNPAEAVMAMLDLEAQQGIGIHFGTFHLTDEGIDAPLVDLQSALKDNQLPSSRFVTLEFGETRSFRSALTKNQ